jgi:hypothetical protein
MMTREEIRDVHSNPVKQGHVAGFMVALFNVPPVGTGRVYPINWGGEAVSDVAAGKHPE